MLLGRNRDQSGPSSGIVFSHSILKFPIIMAPIFSIFHFSFHLMNFTLCESMWWRGYPTQYVTPPQLRDHAATHAQASASGDFVISPRNWEPSLLFRLTVLFFFYSAPFAPFFSHACGCYKASFLESACTLNLAQTARVIDLLCKKSRLEVTDDKTNRNKICSNSRSIDLLFLRGECLD